MLDIKVAYEPFKNANIEYAMSLKVLESVRFFSRGQKVLRLKNSALFCQLSLNMLGRQQQLISLVQVLQVLQMGKTITITKINICIHMQTSQNCSAEQSLLCCLVLCHYSTCTVYYFLTLFAL
jgi:hypothetical protein